MRSLAWRPEADLAAVPSTDCIPIPEPGQIEAALGTGVGVVVVHSRGASLVQVGETATAARLALMVRETSGFVQVALPELRCDELALNEALPSARYSQHAASGQCVAVDADSMRGTGISASDRAETVRVLSSPSSRVGDLRRPGHVVPVRVRPGDGESVAALALQLVSQYGGTAAVFAELTPSTNHVGIVDPVDALQIARRLDSVALQVVPMVQCR